jgi:Helix-turn-helix domain
MATSATTTSASRSHPQSAGDRELERVLALLESDQTGSVTVAALRESGVTAPGQAVYTLQLAGYAIDRAATTEPHGHRALGYRIHGSSAGPSASLMVEDHET